MIIEYLELEGTHKDQAQLPGDEVASWSREYTQPSQLASFQFVVHPFQLLLHVLVGSVAIVCGRRAPFRGLLCRIFSLLMVFLFGG